MTLNKNVNAAKAYFETAKRKRMNSVPETEAPPIQLSNPIVIPTSEIPQPILLMQNHQPSVAQQTLSFVNVQRCSVKQATPLLSRVRSDAWIGGPSSQSHVYPLPANTSFANPPMLLPQIKLPTFSGDPKTLLTSQHLSIHLSISIVMTTHIA